MSRRSHRLVIDLTSYLELLQPDPSYGASDHATEF